MELLSQITITLYLGVLAMLSVYGLHRYYILYLFYRYYKRRNRPEPPPLAREDYPTVTIQLPIFNEYYVAARVIDSAGDLDYPKDRLTIQILDDSTVGEQARVLYSDAKKMLGEVRASSG